MDYSKLGNEIHTVTKEETTQWVKANFNEEELRTHYIGHSAELRMNCMYCVGFLALYPEEEKEEQMTPLEMIRKARNMLVEAINTDKLMDFEEKIVENAMEILDNQF